MSLSCICQTQTIVARWRFAYYLNGAVEISVQCGFDVRIFSIRKIALKSTYPPPADGLCVLSFCKRVAG